MKRVILAVFAVLLMSIGSAAMAQSFSHEAPPSGRSHSVND